MSAITGYTNAGVKTGLMSGGEKIVILMINMNKIRNHLIIWHVICLIAGCTQRVVFGLDSRSLYLMNMHLHRKQIVILALAMALAAASYLIPLPRQTDIQSSPSRLLGPIDQAAPEEAIAYAREPATIQRFPVTVWVPQTPVQTAAGQSAEEARPGPSLPEKRWNGRQDFTNGDRIPTHSPLTAPVKGLDPSRR